MITWESLSGAVASLLLVPAWLVAWRGRDAWPYSCYPMFTHYLTPEQVEVFRIALERPDGSRVWWRPRNAKLQESLGAEFRTLARGVDPGVQRRQEVELVARVAGLVRHDPGPEADVAALCVVRRSVTAAPDAEFAVMEALFRRYPLSAGVRQGLPV